MFIVTLCFITKVKGRGIRILCHGKVLTWTGAVGVGGTGGYNIGDFGI